MCTYNLSFNDSLIERIRPAFPNEEAVVQWMQQQMNVLLVEFAVQQKKRTTASSIFAKDLYGVLGDDGLTADESMNGNGNSQLFTVR